MAGSPREHAGKSVYGASNHQNENAKLMKSAD